MLKNKTKHEELQLDYYGHKTLFHEKTAGNPTSLAWNVNEGKDVSSPLQQRGLAVSG